MSMSADEARARLLKLAQQSTEAHIVFGAAETDACRLAAQSLNNTFESYERAVMPLAFYPGHGTGDATYPILGLNGESGEAAEQLKKALRDDGGMITPERRVLLLKELGDVLWYITACATELGSSLGEVADMNKNKLLDRHARGVLGGSGDTR